MRGFVTVSWVVTMTGLPCIAYLPHKYAMHARRPPRRIRGSERGDCQTRVSWVNEQLLDVLGGHGRHGARAGHGSARRRSPPKPPITHYLNTPFFPHSHLLSSAPLDFPHSETKLKLPLLVTSEGKQPHQVKENHRMVL